MFSSLQKNIPPMNRVDVVSIRQLPNKDWLGITNNKTLLIGNESEKTFHIGGLDYALIALGASAADQVNYLVEQHGKKLNKMKTVVSEKMGEINIKNEIESPSDIKSDVSNISNIVIESLCPIANTLTTKTQIKMEGKVY